MTKLPPNKSVVAQLSTLAAQHAVKLRIIFLILSSSALVGCHTDPDADLTPKDAVEAGALIVPGVVVATPAWLASEGWKVITSRPRPEAYAPEGITVSDFQSSIEKVEGGQCLPELQSQPDGSLLYKYSGKKAIYYGRFKSNHAIDY
jgi:hypothetical protein